VGRTGNVIDNANAGGVFVAVELETGAPDTHAWQHLAAGGATYTRHPDTGVRFAAITIPHFPAVRAMALEAATLLPYRLAGWDIAVTEDGPLMVEGNNETGFSAAEITRGGCLRDPDFRAFFQELMGHRRTQPPLPITAELPPRQPVPIA
jgi:hypothetical protein